MRATALAVAFLCLFVIGAFFVALFIATDGFAHSWYEPMCCSSKDCAPISDDDVIERDGGFYVKSRNEFIAFKDTRQGKDDQYHLCVNEITNVRLCFYRKYSGS